MNLVEYYLSWWNLENLFDVVDSTQRPDWLKAELKSELVGWDKAVLDKKINQLTKIISKLNSGNLPDILGVCEVENKPVMDLLVNSLNSLGRNYEVAHHDTSDKRGIDVAFIYDVDKFTFERQFFHVILKRTGTRDLFQVNLDCKSGNGPLILVGNHWPSRSGGEFKTEPYRILAAETLSYWHLRILEETLKEKGKESPIVFMGDFNDNPYNRSMIQYFLSTDSKKKVEKATSAPRVYNLMWPLMGKGIGTFYWDNFAQYYDQFLVSKRIVEEDTFKVKSDSVKIESFQEMRHKEYEIPKPYLRPSKGAIFDGTGYSDHFPISMILEEV